MVNRSEWNTNTRLVRDQASNFYGNRKNFGVFVRLLFMQSVDAFKRTNH